MLVKMKAGGEGDIDEIFGWHPWLDGHKLEQTLGESEGQGSLMCCSPRGCRESDVTEWLKNNSKGMLGISSWGLSAIYMSSLEKCLLGFLPIFFFFFIELHEVFVYSGSLIPCQFVICKYFLPFWGLPFHFVYDFLCCAIVFIFNLVPFFIFVCIFIREKILKADWGRGSQGTRLVCGYSFDWWVVR